MLHGVVPSIALCHNARYTDDMEHWLKRTRMWMIAKVVRPFLEAPLWINFLVVIGSLCVLAWMLKLIAFLFSSLFAIYFLTLLIILFTFILVFCAPV